MQTDKKKTECGKKNTDEMRLAEHADAFQAAFKTAAALEQRYGEIAQTIAPVMDAVRPCQELMERTAGLTAAVTSAVSTAHPLVPDPTSGTMPEVLGLAASAMETYQNLALWNSGILAVLDTAVMTPELTGLQTQLLESIQNAGTGMSAVSDYVSHMTDQWNDALETADRLERGMAAQNVAVLRMLPDYGDLKLPRGSKRVLKSLTKTAAKKLTQSGKIFFDPKEREFYHKDSPDRMLTADQITVAESSQDVFASISLDELLSFESQLYDDNTFALEHPVGRKIFEMIQKWDQFINFDDTIYYHARKIEKGKRPFLDQEMLKAPLNLSSHGRYNAIGKSCYYISETKEGAVTEIRKHSGGAKTDIQVVGLKPVKSAKIIDLSGEIHGNNRFMEHLRFTVDNEEGKVIKEYLLPNFVASCCKRIGIDGIKYRSTGYHCFVLWNDDYFSFVKDSREIISDTETRP